MNAARRAEIRKAQDLIAQAKDILESCAAEEREFYDNMPDAIRDGEKGTRADEVASALEDAVTGLEDIDLDDAAS